MPVLRQVVDLIDKNTLLTYFPPGYMVYISIGHRALRGTDMGRKTFNIDTFKDQINAMLANSETLLPNSG